MLDEVVVLTPEEKSKRDRDMRFIPNIKDKNEKLSWTRRQKRLEEIVETKLNPLQDQIRILATERDMIIDEIVQMRAVMVKECIHPKNTLVHHGTHLICKFCNAKLSLPRIPEND